MVRLASPVVLEVVEEYTQIPVTLLAGDRVLALQADGQRHIPRTAGRIDADGIMQGTLRACTCNRRIVQGQGVGACVIVDVPGAFGAAGQLAVCARCPVATAFYVRIAYDQCRRNIFRRQRRGGQP